MLYNSRKCPCGYGVISGKLRNRGDHSLFREKFRKHIPVIVPLWFIPSAAGVLYLISEYSHIMLVLLILFCIQAFLILPLYSKYHGCRDCPQKEECSWMKQQTHNAGNKE